MNHRYIKLSLSLLFLWGTLHMTFTPHAFGHDAHYHTAQLHTWHFSDGRDPLSASLLTVRGDTVLLENQNGKIVPVLRTSLSDDDATVIANHVARIKHINAELRANTKSTNNVATFTETNEPSVEWVSVILLTSASLSVFLLLFYVGLPAYRIRKSVLVIGGLSIVLLSLTGFTALKYRKMSTTDPLTMDKAFAPWKNSIRTRWDANYFYVESNGMAEHEMMAGITAWQQQVPLPQCYTGTNSWMIPLNPVLAPTPVPVSPQHFIRGAVAVAVNGIPIFNPYTNTGVDAFLDGQLDNFGGHSGRADDYHYHIAPTHLYPKTSATLPIAYGLDGFAVYGTVEPDGSAMKTLDDNHGHFGTDGVYHYHASSSAPYMIGRMVGKVTEDSTLQIIPQPSARGVRPALTPLRDARIVSCTPNGNGNGYILRYTLNNQNYSVDYRWTPQNATSAQYTYVFTSPTGSTTQNYTGRLPCTQIVSSVNDESEAQGFRLYPHPVRTTLTVELPSTVQASDIRECTITSLRGERVMHTHHWQNPMDVSRLVSGQYTLTLELRGKRISMTFIKE
jgi:hypothetical protein